MTRTQLQERILELPPSERLSLADAIWDSLEEERDSFSLTDSQRSTVHRRLDEFLAYPERALTWPELKARLAQRG